MPCQPHRQNCDLGYVCDLRTTPTALSSGPLRFQEMCLPIKFRHRSSQRGSSEGMKQLWEIADFVRNLHRRLRFGELSRAPLKLLRLELRGDEAECEWVARPADPWDSFLPPSVGERHASLQALEDSLAVRNLLFST